MTFGLRVNRERIAFGEIAEGDRLRVRYTEGGSERSQRRADRAERSVSVTRTLVSVAALRALDKVWLSADGHAVVHRDWEDLEIIRLTDEAPVAVKSRVGAPWTEEEDAVLRQWDLPDRHVSRRLGRTVASVSTRRVGLRRVGSN